MEEDTGPNDSENEYSNESAREEGVALHVSKAAV